MYQNFNVDITWMINLICGISYAAYDMPDFKSTMQMLWFCNLMVVFSVSSRQQTYKLKPMYNKNLNQFYTKLH